MSARKARGNAATGAPAPALRAAALMAAPCEIQRSVTQPAPSGQASACKPNQPAPAPRQAFKATAPQGFEPRPAGAECVYPEAAPSGRSTDPNTPPDLLNPTKGLSMAKTAPVSLQSARKFVPVADLMQSDQIQQTRTCRTVFQRSYTLCEVEKGNRQFVPVSKRPIFVPEKASDFRTIPGSIFGGQKIPRRILSGSYVIPGLSLMGEIFEASHEHNTPAPALGWNGETARKPIGIVAGGAA